MSGDAKIIEVLKDAGLRPTKQRICVGRLLFTGKHQHVSADSLQLQIRELGQKMALATIYNCLHQFHNAGLLKKVNAVNDVIMFDTNLSYHHHFLNVDIEFVNHDSAMNIIQILKQFEGQKRHQGE